MKNGRLSGRLWPDWGNTACNGRLWPDWGLQEGDDMGHIYKYIMTVNVTILKFDM